LKAKNDWKFERDLRIFLKRIAVDVNPDIRKAMTKLKERLVDLHQKRIVKINHSVMELLCVKPLLLKGYDVDVEHLLDGVLSCDVYGEKGDGNLIVEIETGYVPPGHALNPTVYNNARIASKITRYSNYANKFSLGIPPYYIAQIPPAFFKPPRFRSNENLHEIKQLCDIFYKNPRVNIEEVKNARLHSIYIIDVSNATVREVDLETYKKIIGNSSFYHIYQEIVPKIPS
jgi:hypothetical protein